jgi:nitrogen fixation/metabolism regulation signal transduction histidine kinase
MNYLKLEKTEIKELRSIAKENLIIYPIIFILLLTTFYTFLNTAASRWTETFRLSYFPYLLLTILIIAVFVAVYFRSKISYLKDLLANKKKIYSGILASKQHISKNGSDKFYFYMDGNKFSVKKEDFEKFDENDTIQFHLSIHSRHIFKISGDQQ